MVAASSISFHPKMKAFSSIITSRSLLGPHWVRMVSLTSSGCNAGMKMFIEKGKWEEAQSECGCWTNKPMMSVTDRKPG